MFSGCWLWLFWSRCYNTIQVQASTLQSTAIAWITNLDHETKFPSDTPLNVSVDTVIFDVLNWKSAVTITCRDILALYFWYRPGTAHAFGLCILPNYETAGAVEYLALIFSSDVSRQRFSRVLGRMWIRICSAFLNASVLLNLSWRRIACFVAL